MLDVNFRDMGNVPRKAVPILFITLAGLCIICRRNRSANKINLFKGDDTSKENCSRSDDRILKSLTVRDRLSELPIEVCCHIFSFLSLRDMARMATLSRHWKKVCLALPCLDLDWFVLTGGRRRRWCHSRLCESYEQAYVKSVDQVLQKYRDSNILSFHLSCCLSRKYGSDVHRWTSFVAANKGLRSLILQFICVDNYRRYFNRQYDDLHLISGSFLSQFSYLKDLHLSDCILKLENGFRLSNLTTLDLNNVILEGIQWQGILSCSSTIKCLWLRVCNLPNKLCIGDNFPRLSFLMIGGCSNLQELELSAKKLKNFELYCTEALKCSFLNVPNLEEVYLFPEVGAKDILSNLAARASGLKYLFLRGESNPMHELPCHPSNIFFSVLKLRVSMADDDGKIVTTLPCLLKSFPLLKKLEIKLPLHPCCSYNELPVPYVHFKLKDVELTCSQVEYIPVAIYLLKSAVVLDRMVVTKSSKSLHGRESFRWCIDEEQYSDRERQDIQKALMGKASSTSLELLIK